VRRAIAAAGRPRAIKLLHSRVLVVVLFTFLAWSLRVAFMGIETLSDLTLAGVLNEVLRGAIFVGPVLVYLRYVERVPAVEFLRLNKPRKNVYWLLPVMGALFVTWYLLLDAAIGDGRIGGAGFAQVLFAVLSPATLVEEIYFRGFLLNKFRQTMGFLRANFASSSLFALIHFPGWLALGELSSPLLVVDALGILFFGMVFGWAMKRTGSLWPAYALHALNNVLVTVVLVS
jgi:membrane protease YdiL (CAAX protease family)